MDIAPGVPDPAPKATTRADLRAMTSDGIAFSVMVGIGESFVPPFALALGMGDVAAGLIATAPMLVGALLQLVTPWAVARLGSHKRWVVACASLQALTFAPLVFGAATGRFPASALYATVALYWALGMAASPAWNAWAETIVPESVRATYFARRARWCQAALFVGLGAGGALLQLGEGASDPLAPYVVIFALALVARGVSARFIARQSEPHPVPIGDSRLSPAAIRAHLATGGHGRLLVYLLVFQSGVWIAAPYFTPYMLGPLGLDYATFTALTATAFLARVIALPALGRVAHRSGTRRLLWLGSFGIFPLPALWLLSDAVAWLFALQVLSGFAWAAFELATLLSFFEHIPHHARTSVLTIYNLAYATAIAVGGAIGGAILALGGHGLSAYVALMLVSTGVRLLCLRLLRGAPDVVPPSAKPPTMRTLSLRPSAGGIQRPVLPTLEAEDASAVGAPAR